MRSFVGESVLHLPHFDPVESTTCHAMFVAQFRTMSHGAERATQGYKGLLPHVCEAVQMVKCPRTEMRISLNGGE